MGGRLKAPWEVLLRASAQLGHRPEFEALFSKTIKASRWDLELRQIESLRDFLDDRLITASLLA